MTGHRRISTPCPHHLDILPNNENQFPGSTLPEPVYKEMQVGNGEILREAPTRTHAKVRPRSLPACKCCAVLFKKGGVSLSDQTAELSRNRCCASLLTEGSHVELTVTVPAQTRVRNAEAYLRRHRYVGSQVVPASLRNRYQEPSWVCQSLMSSACLAPSLVLLLPSNKYQKNYLMLSGLPRQPRRFEPADADPDIWVWPRPAHQTPRRSHRSHSGSLVCFVCFPRNCIKKSTSRA